MTTTSIRRIELRAGEGGHDAQQFVDDLGQAYAALARRRSWKCDWLSEAPSGQGHQRLELRLEGVGVEGIEQESGGHRVQRVPRNESRGRVHSSTLTVAVLQEGPAKVASRDPSEFTFEWYSGSGAGGQHRNKHCNSIKLLHRPTGLIRRAQTRSRENSLNQAMHALLQDLDAMEAQALHQDANSTRQAQVGMGERSDRRRVWAFTRDEVVDLNTQRRMTCSRALRGHLDGLWR